MHTNKNYSQPQPQHPAAIQRHTWALTGFFFFFQFNSTLFTKHQIKTTAASSRSTTIFAALCESLFHLCSNQLHDHTSLKYILHVYQGEQLVQKSVTHTQIHTDLPLKGCLAGRSTPAGLSTVGPAACREQTQSMYTVDMWTNQVITV